jgi:hypothetical protein
MIACAPVYVDDLYVQNTREMRTVHAKIAVRNDTAGATKRDVVVRVVEKGNRSVEVARQEIKGVEIAAGEKTLDVALTAADAKIWDTEHPNLYVCEVSLRDGEQERDSDDRVFGFRWFEPVGVGSDAKFMLNGKRIVLRSAISWGYWPINGLIATPEMAEKQIMAAKNFGLNMLNFHRCVGQPIILEKADELGLLYYEEPGGYDTGNGNGNVVARGLAQEKWLRMVKRDRSHPSLIIFSMSNETGPSGPALENYVQDMARAHLIDPSRTILRSSGLRSALGIGVEMSTKYHYFPFDDTLYKTGWYDDHHAGGSPVWTQGVGYVSPTEYYHLQDDAAEILFYGEEGALSTPPRLGLIKEELEKSPQKGWDGGVYLEWYKMFDNFLTAKNLRGAFPTVDDFCRSMGNISMEHQGRRIQVIRLNNDNDAYAINGWESELIDNHSGVVDCFRNPKGDAWIMKYYNQPLYIAIMERTQIMQAPGKVVVDFYLINEMDVKGEKRLRVSAGNGAFQKEFKVAVKGGSTYGQPLEMGVEIPVSATGKWEIEAALIDGSGKEEARGRDWILGVDWKSAKLPGKGAILDEASRLGRFFAQGKGMKVPEYSDGMGKVDWVVASSSPNATAPALIPMEQLRQTGGEGKPGLRATFFTGPNFTEKAYERVDGTVDLFANEGAPPDQAVDALKNYEVRWEGEVVPAVSGRYSFLVQSTGTATVMVDGKQVAESGNRGGGRGAARGGRGRGGGGAAAPVTVDLVAGKGVAIKVEWSQGTGDAMCRLLWKLPDTVRPPDAQQLIDRVKNDGTTLVVLEHAGEWLDFARQTTPEIKYSGSFTVGTNWLGGVHFVREHPLFKDLPVNDGMNWPYQAVVRDGNSRTGLLLQGEELAAGAFHSNNPSANPPSPIRLGTALGVVRCGKGRIVVSTLDIAGNLGGPPGPADVARKLLCNYVEYAATPVEK